MLVQQIIIPPLPEGRWGGILFYLCPSVLPSVQDIFRRIFLSNFWRQKSEIWSQASYRYTILWVAFLDPLDSYFLIADLVGFYTHWTYMHIFRHIFLIFPVRFRQIPLYYNQSSRVTFTTCFFYMLIENNYFRVYNI